MVSTDSPSLIAVVVGSVSLVGPFLPTFTWRGVGRDEGEEGDEVVPRDSAPVVVEVEVGSISRVEGISVEAEEGEGPG